MNEGYNGIAHDLETLRSALGKIAAGQEMSGIWTHAETVLKYQEIARKALAATDPDGPTPALTCDYAHLAHSGGGTNHGSATHDLRGYRICDKCYDAIIAAEQRETGYYHEKKDSA